MNEIETGESEKRYEQKQTYDGKYYVDFKSRRF